MDPIVRLRGLRKAYGKRRALAGAFGDADDQAVEQRRGAVDEVHVSVGDRVERPRIHRDAGVRRVHSFRLTLRDWSRRPV